MFLIRNLKCQQFHDLQKFAQKSYILCSSYSVSSSTTATTATSPKKNIADCLESYGQPIYLTHPHLVNQGELVPGVTVEEIQQRRIRFMTGLQHHARESREHIGDTNRSHLVIIPSATKKYMSDKIPYIFRQSSDFFYLTGCLEPDTVLMLSVNDQSDVQSTLFMRPKDKHAELWDGARTGVDKAIELFGVDESYCIDQFDKEFNQRLQCDKPTVWYDSTSSDMPKITTSVRDLGGTVSLLNSPIKFLQSMRLYKSKSEQALMKKTCQIAAEAINEVMRETRPGHSEHHIYAMVDYKCRMRNASHLAYPPVVASGSNATTIHYINNTQLTKSGDLVLLDAGCEYGGYTSDITRTWPVNGVFTEPQKVLYDVIFTLQKELIGHLLKEGGDTLDNLFETMCIKLGKYLQEVGIAPKDIADPQNYAKVGYKFCPHHVSHYLGMDVHDTPLMPRTLKLLPGMVFTVEPGIYIANERTDVPSEFRGIGIRIEDDVLINADNSITILTAECHKERVMLENICNQKVRFQ